MSDTPSNADATMKLLDNGWIVSMYRNSLGSYTAEAGNPKQNKKVVTDDFTPSQALYRLSEKVFGNIV